MNKEKSSFVVSKHCPLNHQRLISTVSGVSKGHLPFQYLGNHLFKGRRKSLYFQPLIDKINSMLSGWQGKLLSPGGRIILLRHVLMAIPP